MVSGIGVDCFSSETRSIPGFGNTGVEWISLEWSLGKVEESGIG